MLRSYKTEINPTPEQKQTINRTIGVCRYIYNFYLSHNKKLYDDGEKFMTAVDFSKWLNNSFLPNNQEFSWIREVSSKSVKQSIINAGRAFQNFSKAGRTSRISRKKANQMSKCILSRRTAGLSFHVNGIESNCQHLVG